jgi:hypothetical protein
MPGIVRRLAFFQSDGNCAERSALEVVGRRLAAAGALVRAAAASR